MDSSSTKSVVVVGGGISGLAVATHLRKFGNFEVTLLEGSKGVGGRVYTRKFGNGYVEMGAEFVHGEKDNRIFEMVGHLGLLNTGEESTIDDSSIKYNQCSEEDFTGFKYIIQTGDVMDELFTKTMDTIMSKIKTDPMDFTSQASTGSFGEVGTKIFERLTITIHPLHERHTLKTAALDWAHRSWNMMESADNWYHTSCTKTAEQFRECEGNADSFWITPNGYASLLNILLTGSPGSSLTPPIPDWIHLEKEVTEIKYNPKSNDQVDVRCKDGSTYKADHVVCTVSLGVLKDRAHTIFNPKLTERKQATIENLGFGSVNKLYFGFDDPWWPKGFLGVHLLWENEDDVMEIVWNPNSTRDKLLEEHNGIPIWCRSLLGFYTVKTNPWSLQSWISGPCARLMETLDEDYVKSNCVKVLRQYVGRFFDVPKPERFARSFWYTNPFTKGSYSYRSVDSEAKNVWAKDLATPILSSTNRPVVCFAGEATHTHYYSTVHGAYDTGIREAKRIKEFYDSK